MVVSGGIGTLGVKVIVFWRTEVTPGITASGELTWIVRTSGAATGRSKTNRMGASSATSVAPLAGSVDCTRNDEVAGGVVDSVVLNDVVNGGS
jgi:hypothetical protein